MPALLEYYLGKPNNNQIEKVMKHPVGTTAKTGERCPESGVWKVQGGAQPLHLLQKETECHLRMGHGVSWELLSYA